MSRTGFTSDRIALAIGLALGVACAIQICYPRTVTAVAAPETSTSSTQTDEPLPAAPNGNGQSNARQGPWRRGADGDLIEALEQGERDSNRRRAAVFSAFSSPNVASLAGSADEKCKTTPNLTNNNLEVTKGWEDLAFMVWNFVNAAGGFVSGLDPDDEMKLLRLRTKKQELVIVPDPKYILVVVHETSSA
ncbi:hypothetical protein B7494_g2964 [Chlorociboria aeruginascens]|nr:hypothetical protein B7494_g2964 [Chlorociboria aeruginascens]